MFAMSVYVTLLLVVWPLAREASTESLKIVCALAPVAPLLGVMALMARKILQSDELEQRTHLIGLGVATAVVSVFSIVGGFLALSKVLSADAAALILIWVFPVLVLTYSGVRGFVARRYGGGGCDEDDTTPLPLRFLGMFAIVGAVAGYGYFYKHDKEMGATALGMAAAFALAALFFGLRRWWTRRRSPE